MSNCRCRRLCGESDAAQPLPPTSPPAPPPLVAPTIDEPPPPRNDPPPDRFIAPRFVPPTPQPVGVVGGLEYDPGLVPVNNLAPIRAAEPTGTVWDYLAGDGTLASTVTRVGVTVGVSIGVGLGLKWAISTIFGERK